MIIEAICIIVFANDRPSTKEIYWHEMAHCNGWVHSENVNWKVTRKHSVKPPRQYLHKYKGVVVELPMSTSEALRECGSLGCQWFE